MDATLKVKPISCLTFQRGLLYDDAYTKRGFYMKNIRPYCLIMGFLIVGLFLTWSAGWAQSPDSKTDNQQKPERRSDRNRERKPNPNRDRNRDRNSRPAVFHTDVPEHPFDIILGRPTENAMTLSMLTYHDMERYIDPVPQNQCQG